MFSSESNLSLWVEGVFIRFYGVKFEIYLPLLILLNTGLQQKIINLP